MAHAQIEQLRKRHAYAKLTHPSHPVNLVESIQSGKDGQIFNKLDHQSGAKIQDLERYIKVLPQQAPAATTLQSGSNVLVDFIFQENLEYIEEIWTVYSVSNSSGSNTIQLAPCHGWAKIETYTDGVSTLIQTLFPEPQYLLNGIVLTPDQLFNMGPSFNFSYTPYSTTVSSFGQPTSQAISSTREYFVPIHRWWLNNIKGQFPLKALKTQLTVRFTLNAAVEGGTGTAVLNSMYLEYQSKVYPAEVIEENYQQVAAGFEVDYTDDVKLELVGQTVTAAVNNNFQLQAFNGADIACWFAWLRASTAITAGAWRISAPLDGTDTSIRDNQTTASATYWLTSDGSTDITGGSGIPHHVKKFMTAPLEWPGQGHLYIDMMWLAHGSVMKTVNGIHDGSKIYDTTHQLVVRPGAGFSTGTYTLSIYGMQWKKARFEAGTGKIYPC